MDWGGFYAGWCVFVWAKLTGRIVPAAVILEAAVLLTWADLTAKSKEEWNFMKEGNKTVKERKRKGWMCCLPTDSKQRANLRWEHPQTYTLSTPWTKPGLKHRAKCFPQHDPNAYDLFWATCWGMWSCSACVGVWSAEGPHMQSKWISNIKKKKARYWKFTSLLMVVFPALWFWKAFLCADWCLNA